MARYTKRPKAEADLLEIWLFIAQESPRAADRLLDRIETQCRLLADNPRLGRERPSSHRTRGRGSRGAISSSTESRMTGSKWCVSCTARVTSSSSSSERIHPFGVSRVIA
jgi:plasmid stabilization system protein ParE